MLSTNKKMTLSRADANGIFDRPLTHVIMMIMTEEVRTNFSATSWS